MKFNFLTRLFKRGQKASLTVKTQLKKSLNVKPSEDSLLERQQQLMEQFYYGPLKLISRPNSDNSYSFGTKSETSSRVCFTGRGAFLHRTDIDENHLFDIARYLKGGKIITATLTLHQKNNDRDVFRAAVMGALKASRPDLDVQSLIEADHATVREMESKDRLWRLYLDNMFIIMLYYYDVRDLTFISERLFRSIFKLMSAQELMKDGADKKNLILELEDKLFASANACLFPLSLNTYAALRDSLPKHLAARMSPVKLKLKMVSQQRYDSPYLISQSQGY